MYGTFRVKVTASNAAKSVSKTFKLVIAKGEGITSVQSVSEHHEGTLTVHEENHESESEHAAMNLTDEYEIIYGLPEISFDEEGMYDFEVSADESVRAGAKLIWLAFPQDAEHSSDDEISEFYDESGAEIESVPDNHRFTVSAWFRKDVTYKPAIAVKRDED